ncbi:MAG: acyl carrier protein [Chloroflexi bacterium]|nr:acyl carrier protein [Chloroflexota bacterium]
MTSDELRAAVLASLGDIAPEADLAGLADDDDLRDELDLDSMDFLNFIIGIHERTGIDVPERDYSRLGTVGAALAYLAAHAAG